MLKLTKRSEYGLVALLHLTESRAAEFVSVREICDSHPLPRRLVAEVLKDLHAAGLVSSRRGVLGGYSLALSAETITLGDVVGALEGKPTMTECELVGTWANGGTDVEAYCPIKNPLERLRTGIWNLLAETTLQDLAQGRFRISPSMTAS